jgi:hypothetical protein
MKLNMRRTGAEDMLESVQAHMTRGRRNWCVETPDSRC